MKNTSSGLHNGKFCTFWFGLLLILVLSLPVQLWRLNQNGLVQAACLNQQGQSKTIQLNLPDQEGADEPSSNHSNLPYNNSYIGIIVDNIHLYHDTVCLQQQVKRLTFDTCN